MYSYRKKRIESIPKNCNSLGLHEGTGGQLTLCPSAPANLNAVEHVPMGFFLENLPGRVLHVNRFTKSGNVLPYVAL
jgi:hypothetical protein